MSTQIIMVRHGYSISNRLKFFTGQSDIELTDTGREQARLCGEYFKVWQPCSACGEIRTERIWDMGISDISAVYSSPLSRACETAQPIARTLGLDVTVNDDLKEINGGVWEMMPFTEIDEKYPIEYGVWKSDIGRSQCVGGESVARLSERVIRAVTDIALKHDGEAVVLVTHATPIRAVCAAASGLDSADMGEVPWVSNASISVFEFDGCFRTIKTNITTHLGELKTDLPKGV